MVVCNRVSYKNVILCKELASNLGNLLCTLYVCYACTTLHTDIRKHNICRYSHMSKIMSDGRKLKGYVRSEILDRHRYTLHIWKKDKLLSHLHNFSIATCEGFFSRQSKVTAYDPYMLFMTTCLQSYWRIKSNYSYRQTTDMRYHSLLGKAVCTGCSGNIVFLFPQSFATHPSSAYRCKKRSK